MAQRDGVGEGWKQPFRKITRRKYIKTSAPQFPTAEIPGGLCFSFNSSAFCTTSYRSPHVNKRLWWSLKYFMRNKRARNYSFTSIYLSACVQGTMLSIKQQTRGWLCCFTTRSGSWFAKGLWGPGAGDGAGKVLWCQIILILYVLLNNTDFILKARRGFWGVELGLERALFGVDFLLNWTVVWLLAPRSTTWEHSWRRVHHWMKAIQGRWGGPGPDLGVVTSQQDATDWMDAGVFNLGL